MGLSTFAGEHKEFQGAQDDQIPNLADAGIEQKLNFPVRPFAAKRQSTLPPESAPKRKRTMSSHCSTAQCSEFHSDPLARDEPQQLPKSTHAAYVQDCVSDDTHGPPPPKRAIRIPRNPYEYSKETSQSSPRRRTPPEYQNMSHGSDPPESSSRNKDSVRFRNHNPPGSRGPHIYEKWNATYQQRVLLRQRRRAEDSAGALAETLRMIAPDNAFDLANAHLSPETSGAANLAQQALESGFVRYGSIYGMDPRKAANNLQPQELEMTKSIFNHDRDGPGDGDNDDNGDGSGYSVTYDNGKHFDADNNYAVGELHNVDMKDPVGEHYDVGMHGADMHNVDNKVSEAPGQSTGTKINKHDLSRDGVAEGLEALQIITSQPLKFSRRGKDAPDTSPTIKNAEDQPTSQRIGSVKRSGEASNRSRKSTVGESRIPKVSTGPRALRSLLTPQEYKAALAKGPKQKASPNEESIRQQKEAALRIARLEKRREGSVDKLFGESPEDEDSKARREQIIQRERLLKCQKEDMQIIEEMQRETRGKLEAAHRKRASEEIEARRAARRSQLTEEDKEINAKKEAERIGKKRKATAVRLEEEQSLRDAEMLAEAERQEREALLENEKRDKLAADLCAAKERAASLRPCKKVDNKTTSLSTPNNAPECSDTVGISDDEGMFVAEMDPDSIATVTNEPPSQTNTHGSRSKSIAINNSPPVRNAARRQERFNSYRPPQGPNRNTIRGRQGWRVARETDIIGRRAEELAAKMAEDKYKRMEAELEARAREREIQLLQESMERERRLLEENRERIARLEQLAIAQQKEKAAEKKHVDKERWEREKLDRKMEERLSREVKKMAEKGVAAVEAALKEKNELAKKTISILSRTQDNLFTSEVRILAQAGLSEFKRKEWNRKFQKSRTTAVARIRAKLISSLKREGEGEVDADKVKELLDAEMVEWESNYRKKKSKQTETPLFASMEGFQSETQHQEPSSSQHVDPETQNPDTQNTETQAENKRGSPAKRGRSSLWGRSGLNADFAKAAAIKDVRQLAGHDIWESDTSSEEDPDDEDDDYNMSTRKLQHPGRHSVGQAQFDGSTSQPPDSPRPYDSFDKDFEEAFANCLEEDGLDVQAEYNFEFQAGYNIEEDSDASLEDYQPPEEDVVSTYKVMHRATCGERETTEVVLKTFLEFREANMYAQKAIRTVNWSPEETLRGLSEQLGKDDLYSGKVVMGDNEEFIEHIWVRREITYTGNILDFDKRDFDLSRIKTRRMFLTTIVTRGTDGIPNIQCVSLSHVRSFANYKAAKTFLELVKPKTANIDKVQQYKNETVPKVQAQVERSTDDDVDMEFESDGVLVRVNSTRVPIDIPKN